MTGPAVTFSPGPLTPVMDSGALGIVIAVEARAAHGELTTLRLHGAYRISVDDARALAAIPLHRALVVVATSGRSHAAFRLLGEALAFDDDEQTGGGVVSGCFGADLLARVPTAPYAGGYVLVSMGPILSNVAAFSAR